MNFSLNPALRKVFCFALVLVMAATLFAGCTKDVPGPESEPNLNLNLPESTAPSETDPVPPVEHDYVVEHEKKASFFSSGVCTRVCDNCGNADVEILPQIVFGNWLKEKGHRRPLLVALLLGVVIVLSRLGKKK